MSRGKTGFSKLQKLKVDVWSFFKPQNVDYRAASLAAKKPFIDFKPWP